MPLHCVNYCSCSIDAYFFTQLLVWKWNVNTNISQKKSICIKCYRFYFCALLALHARARVCVCVCVCMCVCVYFVSVCLLVFASEESGQIGTQYSSKPNIGTRVDSRDHVQDTHARLDFRYAS
jgi:Mn2+/Fe2+ NRAMP family transporter